MKLKRIAALTAAALLAPLGVIATATAASAHTSDVTAICTPQGSKVSVSLSNYADDSKPNHKNTVKVVIDGTTKVDNGDFGTSYSNTWGGSGGVYDPTTAHTYSVVVTAWDDSQFNVSKSGTIASCVTPIKHTTVSATFTEGSVTCVDYQAAYTQPSLSKSGDHVSWTQTGTVGFGNHVTLVAHPDSGYVIDGDSSFAHTYDAKPNAPNCNKIVVPVVPQVTQPVCNGPGTHTDGSFVMPADTADINYTYAAGTGVLTAHLLHPEIAEFGTLPSGWHLRNSSTNQADFQITYTNPGSCLVKSIPAPPTVNQSVCTGPGTSSEFSIELASTTGITYSLSGLVVTATLDQGYRFPVSLPDGWTLNDNGSASFTVTQTDPGLCTVHTSESVSAVGQACITNEDGGGSRVPGSITVVSDDTHHATYAIGGTAISGTTTEANGEYDVVATPDAGYTFGADGSASDTATEHVTIAPVGKDCRTVVTPVQPVVSEGTCDSAGIATLPSDTTGLHYFWIKQGTKIGVVATKGFVLSLGDSGYVLHGHVGVFSPTIPAQLDCQAPVAPNYVTDVTCTTGQSFGPGNDSNFTYSEQGGLLIASPNEGVTAVEGNGFTFQSIGDEQRVLAIAIPDLQGPLSCVSAVAPKVEQSVCTGGDASQATVTLTAVKGLVYTLNGQEVSGKIDVNAASDLTIKAVALDGYTLTGQSSFTVHVNTVTCVIKHVVRKVTSLAFTGSNVAPMIGLAGSLLLGGMVLMVAARRRRNEG